MEDSRTWQRVLAPHADDPFAPGRERLRAALNRFRDYGATLAGEIAADLPEYTVHDITHIDGLWHVADLIVGDELELSPLEGFILGGAFLVHDLAMSSAAFPKRDLSQDVRWRDALTRRLRSVLGRMPTADELDSPPPEVRAQTLREVLRERHAEHAALLPVTLFKGTGGDYWLIEDAELRTAYGPLIGRLGASHWASASGLAHQFPAILNPIPALPANWTADPLKLACIVRTSDAAHLSSQRAPGFLHTLRRLGPVAEAHWTFQQHMQQPRREGDRLVFTTGHAFTSEESAAWWTCLDALQVVDRELRAVDTLLADSGRERFAARSVAHVSDPERLTDLIPTAGWIPIDARVRVGDIGGLVHKLGGTELYGHKKGIAIRELVENSADAIRAYRSLLGDENYGKIRVDLTSDPDGSYTLSVRDDGLGMSPRVMTELLLDFGGSYWESSLMLEELPGLASTSFEATGRFGIGFFSVFMLADKVKIVSRRFDESHANTHVLEFGAGISQRPVLRRASVAERRAEPGTEVELALREPPFGRDGDLRLGGPTGSLPDFLRWMFPSLEVSLWVSHDDGSDSCVVEANEWKTAEATVLLESCVPERPYDTALSHVRHFLPLMAERLRPMMSHDGQLLGRAVLYSPMTDLNSIFESDAAVTIGGARSDTSLRGAAGIVLGSADRAARDAACLLVDDDELARWATEQAELWSDVGAPPLRRMEFADVVATLGGTAAGYPVAVWQETELPEAELMAYLGAHDVISIVSSNVVGLNESFGGPFDWAEDVLVLQQGWRTRLSGAGESGSQEFFEGWSRFPLFFQTMMMISRAWDVDVNAVWDAIRAHEPEVAIGTRAGEPVMGYATRLIRSDLSAVVPDVDS